MSADRSLAEIEAEKHAEEVMRADWEWDMYRRMEAEEVAGVMEGGREI